MNIPYKIKLVEVTKSYKDIEKMNSMLEDVKNEIISIESTNASVNPKIVGNNDLNEINILISKINKAISENNEIKFI